MARFTSVPSPQSVPAAARAMPGGGQASSEARLRTRRPIHWFYLGVLLLALGGIVGGWYLSRSGSTRTVVVVVATITAGQEIQANQLGTAELPVNTETPNIPATRLCDPRTAHTCAGYGPQRGLIGMYAQTTLTRGALLTEDDVATVGRSIIGVAFKPSQMPAQGLAPGDKVRLVLTVSSTGAAVPNSQQQPGTSWPGIVVFPGHADNNGVVTVDVQLASDVASVVAAAAGGGNIAAVLDSRSAN